MKGFCDAFRGARDTCSEALSVQVISEGVELSEERDALERTGWHLLQGYLFGRPAKGFNPPTF